MPLKIVPIIALTTQPIIVEIVKTSISKRGGGWGQGPKKFPVWQKMLNEKIVQGEPWRTK